MGNLIQVLKSKDPSRAGKDVFLDFESKSWSACVCAPVAEQRRLTCAAGPARGTLAPCPYPPWPRVSACWRAFLHTLCSSFFFCFLFVLFSFFFFFFWRRWLPSFFRLFICFLLSLQKYFPFFFTSLSFSSCCSQCRVSCVFPRLLLVCLWHCLFFVVTGAFQSLFFVFFSFSFSFSFIPTIVLLYIYFCCGVVFLGRCYFVACPCTGAFMSVSTFCNPLRCFLLPSPHSPSSSILVLLFMLCCVALHGVFVSSILHLVLSVGIKCSLSSFFFFFFFFFFLLLQTRSRRRRKRRCTNRLRPC